MKHITIKKLSSLLNPLGIYVKEPIDGEHPLFYTLWSIDGSVQFGLWNENDIGFPSGWPHLQDIIDDICNEGVHSFVALDETTSEEHHNIIANPFRGCKSIDEMQICSDFAS